MRAGAPLGPAAPVSGWFQADLFVPTLAAGIDGAGVDGGMARAR